MSLLATAPISQSSAPPPSAAAGVSLLRLNLLRVLYLIMAVGIGVTFWPQVIHHTADFAARRGALFSLLAGIGAFAAVGLRYPLQMLPIALFEFGWKTIFLTAFVLPLWLSNQLDAATADSAKECASIFIFLPCIPWRYVWSNYVMKRGEPWWR